MTKTRRTSDGPRFQPVLTGGDTENAVWTLIRWGDAPDRPASRSLPA